MVDGKVQREGGKGLVDLHVLRHPQLPRSAWCRWRKGSQKIDGGQREISVATGTPPYLSNPTDSRVSESKTKGSRSRQFRLTVPDRRDSEGPEWTRFLVESVERHIRSHKQVPYGNPCEIHTGTNELWFTRRSPERCPCGGRNHCGSVS